MTRCAFPILVLMSFLLMLGTCASWVSSYFNCNVLTVATDRQMFFAANRFGELEFYSLTYLPHDQVSPDRNAPLTVAATQDGLMGGVLSPLNSMVGVKTNRFTYEHGGMRCVQCVQFAIPFWFVTAVSGFLPFVWITTHWSRFATVRRARGQCLACGYDLCGSECDSACPECGISTVLNSTDSTRIANHEKAPTHTGCLCLWSSP